MLDSSAAARRWLRVGLFGALLVAAFSLLSAGSALAVGGTSTVTGQVTVPSAGIAADVSAELLDAAGDQVDSAPTLSHSGTTVTYTFSNEPAGTYLVLFSDSTTSDNLPNALYSATGPTEQLNAATPIQVAAGATATLNTIGLPLGATITGQITDENSSTVFSKTSLQACPDPQNVQIECFTATISGTGAYTISRLPAGAYRLIYTPENSSSKPIFSNVAEFDGASGSVYVAGTGVSYSVGAATTVSVGVGGSASANFTVPQGATISGNVTVLGTPAETDLLVSVYDGSGNGVAGVDTTTAGAYTALVLPGTYKVEASSEYQAFGDSNIAPSYFGGSTFAAATPEAVGAGQTLSGINIDLPRGATISGHITAAQGGAPLGGLNYALVDASGNSALGPLQKFYSLYLGLIGGSAGVELTNFYTGVDGSYAITGVPAGTWYLEIDGGLAWNGTDYLPIFYGGTPTIAGAKPITVTAGQTVTVNQALLQQSATAPGLPTESSGGLSGLGKGKVALKFNLAAGSGVAADLQSVGVKLPKGFSWDTKTLAGDLSLGAGVAFAYTVTGGELLVTFKAGERAAALSIKAGGITVNKAIEKAAGGGPKPKGKHANANRKGGKRRKPKPRKDTIKSETVSLTVTDTTGTVTPLSFIVDKPH